MTDFNNNKIKIWFNPKGNYFEAYMPDGTFLPLQCRVTISDSMGTDSMGCPKATITLLVEVVNEKPQPKTVVDTKCGKVSID